jgi:hypothetical protein
MNNIFVEGDEFLYRRYFEIKEEMNEIYKSRGIELLVDKQLDIFIDSYEDDYVLE